MTTRLSSKSETATDARARRAARRIGLRARKSRRQFGINNLGDFMLVDEHNLIQCGSSYDMTAEEVIAYCTA